VPVLMLWTDNVVAFSRTLKSGKQKDKKKKRKIDYRLLKKSGSMLLNLIFLSISSSSWGYLGGGNCLYTRVKKEEVGEGGGEICFLVFLQFLLILFVL